VNTTSVRPLDQIDARLWRSKYQELFNWNVYQQNIFNWIETGVGNAMVGAVAGSGKTTSITGIVAALPATSKIQIVAFNRHIAQKLKSDARIPKGRVQVSTAHSLGRSLLTTHFRGEMFSPDERKFFYLSKDAVQQLLRKRVAFDMMLLKAPKVAAVRYPVPPPPLTAGTAYAEILALQMRRFIQDVADFARLTLTPLKVSCLTAMIKHFAIEVPDSSGALEWGIDSAIKVLNLGEKLAAEEKRIDFTDMLWLPNRWQLPVPSKQFLIIDEAQDTNAAMIGLYQRMVQRGARLILLGDERQAIFGFSGSDANSWQSLRSTFNPTELPLSICYRCPVEHLNLARRIVPEIEAKLDAPQGVVQVLHPDRVLAMASPGDLILCRLTAPLIDLCLKLIIAGKQAKVRGRDLGNQLADLANTAAINRIFPTEFQQALDDYCLPKIVALKENNSEAEANSLSDRLSAISICFVAFGSECQKLSDFCLRIISLFSDEADAIVLSTLHRAKGDEADRVFLLGTNVLPFVFKSTLTWQIKQEWNLVYVALTRAKTHLFLVPIARNKKDEEHLPQHLRHPLGGMELPQELPSNQLEVLADSSPEDEHSSATEVQNSSPNEPTRPTDQSALVFDNNHNPSLQAELKLSHPVQSELPALGSRYQHSEEKSDNRRLYRFRVNWHGQWVDGLRLVSPPVESPDPKVRCQAWRFASESGQKYYAWNLDDWSEPD
jgi:hypothetical protein